MKNTKLILALSLLGTSFAQSAIAKETYDDRYYLAPTLSYIWTDSDRQTSRNDYGLGLGVGKAVNENVNLELKAFMNQFEHKETSANSNPQFQWDNYGLMAEAQYYCNRGQLSPYGVVGAGAMDSRVHGKNKVGMIAEAGVGLAYKLSEDLSLRSDVRYRYNNNFNYNLTSNNADEYNDMVVNIGVVIPLGKAQSKTHSPVPVAKPASVKEKSMTLKGVNFKVGSSVLTAEAKAALDKVASDLKSMSNDKTIEIQGHSSPDGNKDANLVLSQKRAESVVSYLKNSGVKNDMNAKGYGSSVPVSDIAEENRRVDLVWK